MFAHVCAYVCSTCTHMCALIAHAMFQWYTYVCPTRTHMCALIARLCVPGERMCVPRVHTCVSELDTRFIVFQMNTHVCST